MPCICIRDPRSGLGATNGGRQFPPCARTNAGEASHPEIVSPASVATIGGKTAVTLSMRLAFDGTATRVDHFWLLAGSDIAGLTCVVADTEYRRARPAFERIFTDMAVRTP